MMRVSLALALLLLLLLPYNLAQADNLYGGGVRASGVSRGVLNPGSEPGGGGEFACNDLADNDSDGVVDYPGDMGCSSPFDDDESGDNLVIVGATINSTQLNNCINGTDQGTSGSVCNNVSGSKGSETTVIGCSSSSNGTNTCASPTLREVTGTYSYPATFASTSYNFMDFNDIRGPNDGMGNVRSGFAVADMRLVDSRTIHTGSYPDAGMEWWSVAPRFVVHRSYIDGGQNGTPITTVITGENSYTAPPDEYCEDNQAVLQAADGRITESELLNFCPWTDSDAASHAEVLWVGSGGDRLYIADNLFRDSGGTSHIFFSSPYASDVCVKSNEFGHRLGNADIAEFTPGSSTTIYVETSNVTAPGHQNYPGSLSNILNDGARSCRQCNDGIDNDSDGRADWWPDGNGDTNCSSGADNTEN